MNQNELIVEARKLNQDKIRKEWISTLIFTMFVLIITELLKKYFPQPPIDHVILLYPVIMIKAFESLDKIIKYNGSDAELVTQCLEEKYNYFKTGPESVLIDDDDHWIEVIDNKVKFIKILDENHDDNINLEKARVKE